MINSGIALFCDLIYIFFCFALKMRCKRFPRSIFSQTDYWTNQSRRLKMDLTKWQLNFLSCSLERNRTCNFKSNLEGFRLPLLTVQNCCQRCDRWSALRYKLGGYDEKENIHFNVNLITGISTGLLFRSSRCRSSIPSYISGWLSSLYFFILPQVSTVSFVMFPLVRGLAAEAV